MFSFICVHHECVADAFGSPDKMSHAAARNLTWLLCKYKFS